MFGIGQAQTAMNPYSNGAMGANGMTGGFGGFGGGSNINSLGPLMGLGQQTQQMGSMMDQMMTMMGMVMQMTMMQQMMSMASSFGGGGSASGSNGIGNFLGSGGGGSDSSGGTSATGGTSSATETSGGDGNGSKAVEIAQKYLGQKSGQINNMANFTHAGGMTNNCADFVSACLANAGTYKKKPGDASVRVLKGHLQADGWKKVAKAQAKPGDVAIFNGTQHIELVATKGATQLIGSNNKGNASTQTVSTDSGSWGSVEYFSKG